MKGYLVTVEGDYFGSATEFDRKRQKFTYKVKVKVPSPDGALSLIKNKLLDKVLRRQYPNYHMWRTHQLVSITNLDGSKVQGITNIRLMDFNDLANYVRINKLPVRLELYTDLGYLRTMVFLAETNQHEFRIKQASLEKDCEENKALRALNPDLYDSEDPQPLEGSELRDKIAVDALVDSVHKTTPEEHEQNMRLEERHIKHVPYTTVPDSVHKTTIIEGETPVIKATKTHSVGNAPRADENPSVLITENKPAAQKVQKVFVKGKGFVDADDFKEDFTRKDEEEYEVYNPIKSASVEDL